MPLGKLDEQGRMQDTNPSVLPPINIDALIIITGAFIILLIIIWWLFTGYHYKLI